MNYSLKLLQIILKTKIRKTHRLMVSVIRGCVFFCYRASPQTWVLAMKNPRILRGLRRFYRNDQDH